jgi:hypothetical protein
MTSTPNPIFKLLAAKGIEWLEARIAPATLVNPTTVTYQDIDGDSITVKISKPVFDPATIDNVFTFNPPGITADNGTKQQLRVINFTALADIAAAAGANLSITAVKRGEGDGLVNVGAINATGIDLGKVSLRGDLGQIDAGDVNIETAGLVSLTVRSLGRYGLATQGGVGNLQSDINGSLGTLKVDGDVQEARVVVGGGSSVKITSVSIKGSLVGGLSDNSGSIRSAGDMGLVRIGRDVVGGAGENAGNIFCNGKLAGVSIGGMLRGGSGSGSGSIFSSGDLGFVRIGSDVVGDVGDGSAQIFANNKAAGITVGGSLLGGTGGSSAQFFSAGNMGAVKIGKHVIGGAGEDSAQIRSDSTLASVTVGGSLRGGFGDGSGTLGGVQGLGLLKIGGDVIGGPAKLPARLPWVPM